MSEETTGLNVENAATTEPGTSETGDSFGDMFLQVLSGKVDGIEEPLTTGDGETETDGIDSGEPQDVPTTDNPDADKINPQGGDETQAEGNPLPKRELRLRVNHEETLFDVNGATDDELTVLIQKGKAYDQLKAAREDAKRAEEYRERVQRFINDEGQSEEIAKALAASLSGGKTYPVNVSDDGVVTLSDEYKPDFPDFGEIETARATQEPTQAEAPKPSLDAELKRIRAMFPGVTEIPKEAVALAAKNGCSISDAMFSVQWRAMNQRIEAMAKENKILKQNAEAARKAPVRGVSGGGTSLARKDAENDPFLREFLKR